MPCFPVLPKSFGQPRRLFSYLAEIHLFVLLLWPYKSQQHICICYYVILNTLLQGAIVTKTRTKSVKSHFCLYFKPYISHYLAAQAAQINPGLAKSWELSGNGNGQYLGGGSPRKTGVAMERKARANHFGVSLSQNALRMGLPWVSCDSTAHSTSFLLSVMGWRLLTKAS